MFDLGKKKEQIFTICSLWGFILLIKFLFILDV